MVGQRLIFLSETILQSNHFYFLLNAIVFGKVDQKLQKIFGLIEGLECPFNVGNM